MNSTRNRLRALGTVLALTARTAPAGSALLALLLLARVAAGAGFTLTTGALLGAVAERDRAAIWSAFALLAAAVLAQLLLQPVTATLAAALGRRVTMRAAELVVEGATGPAGVGHLHDSEVVDLIGRARAEDGAGLPAGRAVSALSSIAVARLGALVSAVLLAGVLWWAPLPLAAAWLLTGWLEGRRTGDAAVASTGQTTELRRAGYLRGLALEPGGAREVRLFGLAGWLAEGFVGHWANGMSGLVTRRAGWPDRLALLGLLGAHALVFVTVAARAGAGGLPVAAVGLAVPAALGMSSFGWLGDLQWQAASAAAAAPAAIAVARVPLARLVRPGELPAAGLPRREIAFRNVHFGYRTDQGTRQVLSGMDLVLPAGRSTALVGANGAGKTTLLALLARLHEPDRGRITVDGLDLTDLDLEQWRRQLAVVFQRPGRLDLTARDNVGLGRPDRPRTDAVLTPALHRAGAAEVFATLPGGWDTPLSRGYAGGHELSGGQWQRLALARAMFAVEHGARVLALDEPTAHLDVHAERELYERFLELTGGLTTVLISHRFATVRLADHICVLHEGRVAESGSHEQLLAAGGRYAQMFHLQAHRLTGANHG